MSVSISASESVQPVTKETTAPSAAHATQLEHPVAGAKDTVHLSQAAQVHQMRQQGQSASQIQSSLGISVAVLDGYLGIKAVQPQAAAPVAPGGAGASASAAASTPPVSAPTPSATATAPKSGKA